LKIAADIRIRAKDSDGKVRLAEGFPEIPKAASELSFDPRTQLLLIPTTVPL
jgi:hypothetical protein